MSGEVPYADLRQAETAHGYQLNASGERLRGLPQHGRGCAAQDKEASRKRFAVRQDAQDRKQFRPTLDLVNHNQTAEIPQGGHGFI